MNFYVRQAQARRTSRWLVVLFVLALLAVVVTVNFLVLMVMFVSDTGVLGLPPAEWVRARPGAVVLTSLLVASVVGFSSLYKSVQLSQGGGAVARALGGVRLEREVRDPLRRRLFNVVEEMAIAAGLPLPEIYVLEHEDGINAFAAGHLPANAAVAVTRGALEKLNRSELQGVIAHEVGHVLNGDMRINTRLIGLLFGLLVVALIGRTILRFGPGRSRKGGGALLVAALAAALAVMVLGYLGVFFGRIIQAAVSRRREALADAAAVQFTRDPLGLKGALVKIGGLSQGLEQGSRLHTAEVDEVAHMLFAPGMARLFATHPPLVARIRALDPSFNEQEFAAVRADPQLAVAEAPPPAPRAALELAPAAIAALVGHFDGRQVRAAHAMSGSVPTALLSEQDGAQAVLLALAMDSSGALRARQFTLIGECLGAPLLAAMGRVYDRIAQLQRAQRLPMLHQAIPELRRLPGAQRRRLLNCVERLILADGRMDVQEYVIATVARVYLRDELQPLAQPRAMTLKHAIVELQSLFSVLARHGNDDEAAARRAYEAGVHHLLPYRRLPYKPVSGWATALDRALKCLDRLPPAGKEQLIEALVRTISHDGKLTVDETELLRAICAAIHCPLPAAPG
jgi:Zn-dependent protease with chaperone function